MNDLICRQAAIEAMSCINDSICEGQAIDALSELPTIDPVKHGMWLSEDGMEFHCSVCDFSAEKVLDGNQIGLLLSPYCPNCGARMDE